MLATNSEGAAHREHDGDARELDQLGSAVDFLATPHKVFRQGQSIRAEIVGSDQCRAEGYTARASAPVLALCRVLVEAGFDPGRPLHVFRGATLCLTIRTIGEGAVLTVKERPFGPVFERWVPFQTPPVSPPMRQNGRAGALLAGARP